MRQHLVLMIVAITLSTLGAYGGTDAKSEPRVLSLCELVDNWKDHTRQEVRVRAVYAVGAEQAVLYDPACQEGKDLTYVEFRPHAKGATKKLDRIVAKSRRAWVQLEGVFYGPELYTDVDPKLPPAIRERLEKSPRHYGHMDSMDTMISVTRVIEASEVAPDVPVEKTNPSLRRRGCAISRFLSSGLPDSPQFGTPLYTTRGSYLHPESFPLVESY